MNTLHNPIRHNTSIPPDMTGRVADIHRDVTKIIGNDVWVSELLNDDDIAHLTLPIEKQHSTIFVIISTIFVVMFIIITILYLFFIIDVR